METKFKIKPITIKNIEEVIELTMTIFPNDVPTPEESFWASLYPKSYKLMWNYYKLTYLKYWVLYEKDKIIGTVGIYSLAQDELLYDWIGWLCIKHSHRNKGHGMYLMKFIMDKMRERGKQRVKLYTDEMAIDAIRLYNKLAFKKSGKGQDPNGEILIYFEREL